MQLKIGSVHQSTNYGKFVIVSDDGWRYVMIEFPSGYKATATRAQIKKGQVMDRFKRNYYGVGYIGGVKYKVKGNMSKAFSRWRHMLERCYDEKAHQKMPTYIDCSVCEEWHNYQNYAEWFYANYREGCEVDKDIAVEGNRIYSPETCLFVSHQENSEKATAKDYVFMSPLGVVVDIYNLAKFCRDNNLTSSLMYKVMRGVRDHHKGWTAIS